MTIQVNDENFEEILKTEKPIMLKLGAEWCAPCKALIPTIEEIATEYEGRAVVGDVDVEEAPGINAKYRVRNVPTILFIKGGELKDKCVGSVSKETLTSKLDAIL